MANRTVALKVGDTATLRGKTVRVVGRVTGLHSLSSRFIIEYEDGQRIMVRAARLVK